MVTCGRESPDLLQELVHRMLSSYSETPTIACIIELVWFLERNIDRLEVYGQI